MAGAEDFWKTSARIIQSLLRMKLKNQTIWYPFLDSSKEISTHYLDQRFLMDKKKQIILAFLAFEKIDPYLPNLFDKSWCLLGQFDELHS